MKRSLLALSLAAIGAARQQSSHAQQVVREPQSPPIEPGHVMSREKWEEMLRQQQQK